MREAVKIIFLILLQYPFICLAQDVLPVCQKTDIRHLCSDLNVMYGEKGAKYTGEFVNDKRHGRGVLVFGDNNRYSGFWENDLANGQGVTTWPIGTFSGNHKNGVPYGWVSRLQADGTLTEGFFLDTQWEGVTRIFRSDDSITIAIFKKGKNDGAYATLSKGIVEIGNMIDGVVDGDWKREEKSGKLLESGKWKNGKFTKRKS